MKRDKREKIEHSIQELWGNIKQNNILVTGTPEGRKKRTGYNLFEEIMAGELQN